MYTNKTKNLLLGVSGSISAYKAYDLTREMKRRGHTVRVVLTKGAEEFVQWRTFLYLGAEAVYRSSDDFLYPKNDSLEKREKSEGTPAREDVSNVLHIALARWCDVFAIAPLSAATASRLVHGQVSDLLSSVFLSLKRETPQLFFPAMNTQMLTHPFYRANQKQLEKLENTFVHPTSAGELACGEEGAGKLPPIEEIADLIECFPRAKERREQVLISTGATVSPLDPVRYLTNPSSGKTGFFLAKKALQEGFRVKVLAGMNADKLFAGLLAHPSFELEKVSTNKELYEAVKKALPSSRAYISSAAVTDLKFSERPTKLKKEDLTGELRFEQDTDILAEAIKMKTSQQYFVGFAAETDLTEPILKEKLSRKPVDLLVGTRVTFSAERGGDIQGFQNNGAEYALLEHGPAKDQIQWKTLTKEELADILIEKLKTAFTQDHHL